MPDRPTSSTLEVMPATRALLAAVRRRLMSMLALEGISAGLLLATAVLVILWTLDAQGTWTPFAAGLAGVALASGVVMLGWHRLAPINIAARIERRDARLDNLLLTTVELGQRLRPVHPLVLNELLRQTDARVRSVAPSVVVPLGRVATLAAVVAIGAVLAWWGVGKTSMAIGTAPTSSVGPAGAAQPPTVTITVTPPAYTSLPTTTLRAATTLHSDAPTVRSGRPSGRPEDDASKIEALEGSRVRIEVGPTTADVQLIETGHAPLTFQRNGELRSLELTAERTRFLLLRFTDQTATPDRLLALLVKPDAAPIVRIKQPARDLVFGEPRGRVKVEIEASDDLALSTLSLRYTRVFGSGESMTFQEGELPLRVERADRGQWRATSDLSLEGLQLADGDTLVYRATTRDLRPGRDPSSSEAYLLEVGRLAEAASAGFALPEDKDRQAISQQMVIVKTERLHAERDRLSRTEFEERARMLAVEQRMVRAEFVFMTGGEVQDEVAEAEHSHDLAEGRFENEGQVELLTAIREMSRAEARLNDAATEPALVLERAALKALQRAFDRRRYLLRTTPERARIDQARRLTGTLTDARSWRRPPTTSQDRRDLEQLEVLAGDLGAAKHSAGALGPLAARLGSVDPSAPEIQKAALRLSAGGMSDPERVRAIDETLQLLANRARKALSPAGAWVPRDPAAGRYADALERRSGKR